MATAAANLDAEAGGCQATPSLGGNCSEKTRAFKLASHKNSVHRSDFTRQSHLLDRERKSLQVQLEREENEVRLQLHRLQGEQRLLQTLDRCDYDPDDYVDGCPDISITRTESIPALVPQLVEVVNPYPITIVRRISTPSRPIPIKVPRPGHRRVSVELEDLEFQTSTGQFLPPLHSSLVNRSQLVSSNVDSTWSLKSSTSPREKKSFWVGDPEAISSIRRPRKTAAQLRRDQVLSRSQSLKEGTQIGKPKQSSSSSSSSTSIIRSHSMRESGPPKAASTGWSRSNSLKERPHRDAAIKNLTQEMVGLSVESGGGGGSKRGKPRWYRNRQRPRRHTTTCSLGSSPEAKSSLWGTSSVASDLADVDDLGSSRPTSTSELQRSQSSLSYERAATPSGESPMMKNQPLPPIAGGATGQNKPSTCWEVQAVIVTNTDDDDNDDVEDTKARAEFY